MKALFESVFGIDHKTPRWLIFVVICGMAALSCWYVASAIEHGIKKNLISEYNDQRTYMKAGLAPKSSMSSARWCSWALCFSDFASGWEAGSR